MPVPTFLAKHRRKLAFLAASAVIITIAYAAGQAIGADNAPPTRSAHADTKRIPKPQLRPTGLLEAKRRCNNTTPKVECRAEVRRLLAALAWERNKHAQRAAPSVEYAIRLACASQPDLDCNWFRRMLKCESGMRPWAKNRSSTASGLAQFLDGTWSGNLFGDFSVFDPIPNALGAAWLAVRNGHAPWYASKGCWS